MLTRLTLLPLLVSALFSLPCAGKDWKIPADAPLLTRWARDIPPRASPQRLSRGRKWSGRNGST